MPKELNLTPPLVEAQKMIADFLCSVTHAELDLKRLSQLIEVGQQEIERANGLQLGEGCLTDAQFSLGISMAAFAKPLLPAGRFISRKFKNNKMNKYKEIEFGFGNIESAVKELKSHNELVCGSFNGQMLYSDIDDLDSAYVKITGKTKAECDEAERIRHEEYEEQQRKHKEAIPELTKEWIEKGNTILDEKYCELWAKCVPIRLGDLYQGMELGNCLEIVEQLNNGKTVEEVKPLIENQGHSGMSFGLVCSMIKSFCDRGEEFVNYARS